MKSKNLEIYDLLRKEQVPAWRAFLIARRCAGSGLDFIEAVRAVRAHGADVVFTVLRGLEAAPFGAERIASVVETTLGVVVAPSRSNHAGTSAIRQGYQLRDFGRLAGVMAAYEPPTELSRREREEAERRRQESRAAPRPRLIEAGGGKVVK